MIDVYVHDTYVHGACLFVCTVHVQCTAVHSQTSRLNRERLPISKYLLSHYVECN